MWFFYNILFFVGYIILFPHFLVRMLRRGGYRKNFMERFGCYDVSKRMALGAGRTWVHAVSVGEVNLALALLEEMRAEDPSLRFLISTTTSTGYAILRQRKHADDVQVYFPVDFPWVVRSVVRMIQPRALILLECELWPNLLRRLARSSVPVWVVNGRISERSYKGYRKVRVFFKRAASWVAMFFVQTEGDAERLRSLGVNHIQVLGSAKFDLPLPDEGQEDHARSVVRQAGMDLAGMFWVMGSTWPGEERALLDVFCSLRKKYPALQAILVPRHAERGNIIASLLRERSISFVQRSQMGTQDITEPPAVLLADSTGELAGYYMLADFVFVGKSMADNHGGQNPVEPAALGKAVITGANMENFSGVMADLLQADAIWVASDFRNLEEMGERLITDEACRQALGTRAAALVASRRGVMRRSAQLILADLPQAKR